VQSPKARNRKGFKPLAPLSPKDEEEFDPPRKLFRDDDMKRLLLVLVLIIVAISGCTEKSPSGTTRSAEELKTLSISSAENLTSYSLNSSVTQTLELNGGGANAVPENTTKVTESATTIATVNLSRFQAQANGSTKSLVVQPGFPANSSTTLAVVYQIGNSTYMMDEGGNWTHLLDPRSANEIWGQGNNNQVKAIAESFNKSKADETGSETINGEDAYKLNIVTGSGDYDILYNTAIGIAAKLTQYPMYMPSVNRTELNETGKIEKAIWISKETYLPVKYQSQTTFRMTPAVIGGLNSSTGQMEMFKQSMKLPPVSVSIKTIDLYYDFNKPAKVILPAGALTAPVVRPTQTQPQVAQQA
jgi:outer membrane lipoprotein-sorting protein